MVTIMFGQHPYYVKPSHPVETTHLQAIIDNPGRFFITERSLIAAKSCQTEFINISLLL